MKHLRSSAIVLCLAMLTAQALAGDASTPQAFRTAPTVTKDNAKVFVEFAVAQKTDVEVAIVTAKGEVVRHLAAGVLGAETPPPAPLQPGLAQKLEWDGKNDFGELVPDSASCSARVRAGMSVKLDAIAGGDPYAFFSKEMGAGDHFIWKITGMDVKADGSVFVMGNSNNYGPPAIRQYAADGTYKRTVYPFPAGKPVDTVQGWGVNVRADGTYAPGYSDLASPALSRIPIAATRSGCASLLPSPDKDAVTVSLLAAWDKPTNLGALINIGTDGTLQDNKSTPVFADAPKPDNLAGPLTCAYSPDGKFMYVNGIFSYTDDKTTAVQSTGFWRDGQVWKVDLATRKSTVFFSLDEKDVVGDMKDRRTSPIGHLTRYTPFAALQGLAVDDKGNVLIGDRQNKRVVALDPAGKLIREIPVLYSDALALDPASHALYVTTRTGDVYTKGEVKLLKFNDWTKDTEPSITRTICPSYGYSPRTFLGACRSGTDTLVWLAYTTLPVHIYKDKGNAFDLFKDFYEAGPQRALDLQHIVADPRTDHLYISDGSGACFRITDWKNPVFVRCMQDEKTPLSALNLAVDARHRVLYGHADRKPVVRYKMDEAYFTPIMNPNSDTAVTPAYNNDWRIGLGFGDRGLAVAPDGSVVTLGALINGKFKGDDYGGYLHFFKADTTQAPWHELYFEAFGAARSGGVRFDSRGNLYVGRTDTRPKTPPAGFEKDSLFLASLGHIYKFAPTGTAGNLFPSEPAAPAKIYDVNYGSISNFFGRTCRFGVDAYGRIYYPTSLEPKVSVIDNEGNPVVSFGTYGNRDSMGGLPGDRVPTKDIPMAWPNSVDATDDYIYVSDLVNIRVMRLAKSFAIDATVKIQN